MQDPNIGRSSIHPTVSAKTGNEKSNLIMHVWFADRKLRKVPPAQCIVV
jgi:hypothetical protein